MGNKLKEICMYNSLFIFMTVMVFGTLKGVIVRTPKNFFFERKTQVEKLNDTLNVLHHPP